MFIFRLVLHNNLNIFGSPASTAFHSASCPTTVALTWFYMGPMQFRLIDVLNLQQIQLSFIAQISVDSILDPFSSLSTYPLTKDLDNVLPKLVFSDP